MKRTKEEIEASNKETGKRLKKIRIATKLTKEQMAEALKVSVEEYNGFEDGSNELCSSHIMALYQISPWADPDYLVIGKASPDVYVEKALQTMPEEEYQNFFEKLEKYLTKGSSAYKEVMSLISDLVQYGREHINDKRLRDSDPVNLYTRMFEEGMLTSVTE